MASATIRMVSATLLTAMALTAGHACLWDSDTIADEAKKFPDLIDVATGRFDRYPPLFYQMRLDRVTKELKTNPAKLDDYDDAGVACTRLGKDDEALRWMAKKRAEMRLLNSTDPDQTYRLLANEGTFYAHKWFHDGQKKSGVALLDKSIADLKAAVKLNPNAHFGREKIQIAVIEWLKLVATAPQHFPDSEAGDKLKGERDNLGEYLYDKKYKDPELLKGLTGLVVLGDAWRSLDIFNALYYSIPSEDGATRHFLWRRELELFAAGAPHLGTLEDVAEGAEEGKPRPSLLRSVDGSFDLLRHFADREGAVKSGYMILRMKVGRHPDTDPTFWNGWRPPTRPAFLEPTEQERAAASRGITSPVVVGSLLSLIVLLLLSPLFFLYLHLRGQRASRGRP